MIEHYLYLEAVNLGNVIEDTEDLSTRRAGGYMLLELVHKVEEDCTKELEAISVGASAGLFQLLDGQSMTEARNKVAGVLAQPLYAQATVLIADTETNGIDRRTFKSAREGLLACVRLQQMQTLGLITDFGPARKPAIKINRPQPRRPTEACEIDGVRPAVEEMIYGKAPETRWQSQSVTLRRKKGIPLRGAFYQRELGRKTALQEPLSIYVDQGRFTDHFDELTRFDQGYKDILPPGLDHKMAVFYADGDGFGDIAAGCDEPCDLRQWDQAVQSARRNFLRKLIERIETHPFGRLAGAVNDKGVTEPDRLRIETLMWGGDELLIVLPAWLALEAAQLFFEACRIEWPAGQPRQHSAALVFAHHNAPIGPLKNLASSLADTAKVAKKKAAKAAAAALTSPQQGAGQATAADTASGANSLSWMVLESFDHAGGELDSYWRRRDLPNLCWPLMTLSDTRLATLCSCWSALADVLPRRAVHRIVYGLQDWDRLDDQHHRLVNRAYANVHEAVSTPATGAAATWRTLWLALQPSGGAGQAWQAAAGPADASGDGPADDPNGPPLANPVHLSAWLTLNELWDYLPRQSSPAPAATQAAAAPINSTLAAA